MSSLRPGQGDGLALFYTTTGIWCSDMGPIVKWMLANGSWSRWEYWFWKRIPRKIHSSLSNFWRTTWERKLWLLGWAQRVEATVQQAFLPLLLSFLREDRTPLPSLYQPLLLIFSFPVSPWALISTCLPFITANSISYFWRKGLCLFPNSLPLLPLLTPWASRQLLL